MSNIRYSQFSFIVAKIVQSSVSGASDKTVVPSGGMGWLHLICPGIELVIKQGHLGWPENGVLQF